MPTVKAAVKAIILKGNKFLVVKENKNEYEVWDLPGGKIEYGETPHETLTREIKEETDLDIEIKEHAGIWWFYSQANKYQVICNTFICQPLSEKVDLTKNPAEDELHVDYRWVTKNEYLSKEFNITNKSLRKLISDLKF